ncbi:hypothetical protein ABBQ38_004713 [Trebouxia sp. C0009 RCD-2024]
MGDIVIKPQSSRRVWWRCDQCPDGHLHTWSAKVQNRSNGNGCPQCSGRKVCKHNSLATKAPLVAAQWDYQANDCTPDDVVAQNNHMANWHCKVCGCKWEASPNARVSKKKAGCPQCGDDARTKNRTKHPTFAECKHLLLAEWDYERNAAQGHSPDRISLKSGKQIFWLCTKCQRGKSIAGLLSLLLALAAPSQAALFPETAAEWDYNMNKGLPCDHTASSTHLAWWSTPQRASWQQTIVSRTDLVQKQLKAAKLKHVQERQVSAGL